MKVRIVTTSYPHVGGIAAIVRVVAARMAEEGETEIFCLNRSRDRWTEGRVSVVAMGVGRLNQLVFPFMWATVVATFLGVLVRQARQPAAVLVSQDGYAVGLGTGLAARVCRVRHVQMDHGTATNILDQKWEQGTLHALGGSRSLRGFLFRLGGPSRRLVVRWAPRFADLVLFSGHELGEFYERLGARAPKQGTYCHLIDTNLFRPAAADERSMAREALGVPNDATLAVISGRLDPEKGLEWSIPALVRALEQQPSLHLIVVGHGSRAAWTRQQLTPFVERGRARFIDPLDPGPLRSLLAASDLQVYSGEVGCAFSIALLEGMACGCAPIATPVPRAHADVITPVLGWITPVGDGDALTSVVVSAAGDHSGIADRGAACHEYVRAHHDAWGAAGEELVQLILAEQESPMDHGWRPRG